jgi:hypothetical protein
MSEYLIKSTVAISFAYLLYLLLMRKGIDFRWLRLYFIGVTFIALMMPAVNYLLPNHQKVVVRIPDQYVQVFVPRAEDFREENVTIDQTFNSGEHHSVFTLVQVVTCIYFIGVLCVIVWEVIGFFQLAILVFGHGVTRRGKHRFVFIEDLQSPFSFFHLIFIDPHQFHGQSNDVLLQHETVHVRQWHSMDLILMEVLTAIHWFNPLVWHMKRTLKEVHEFLADQGAISDKYPPLDYQRLLIAMTCGFDVRLPIHGMNSSLTKKRIQMITNSKQNKKRSVILTSLIVAIFTTGLFSGVSFARYSGIRQEVSEVVKKDSVTKADPRKDKRSVLEILNDTVSARDSLIGKFVPEPIKPGQNSLKELPLSLIPIPLFNSASTIPESNQLMGKYLIDHCNLSGFLTDEKSTISILVRVAFDTNGKVKLVTPGNRSDVMFQSRKVKNITDQPVVVETLSKALYAAPAFKLLRKNNKICDELNYLFTFQKKHCSIYPLTLVFHKVN